MSRGPRSKPRRPVEVVVEKCCDPQCRNCVWYNEFPVRCNECLLAPSNEPYQTYTCSCDAGNLRTWLWEDDKCLGNYDDNWSTRGCHSQGLFGEIASDDMGRGTWFRYRCKYYDAVKPMIPNLDELRQSGDSDTTSDKDKNAGITVVIVFIVCMIGFIVGHLIRRKRKELTEQTLLCNANKATEISA